MSTDYSLIIQIIHGRFNFRRLRTSPISPFISNFALIIFLELDNVKTVGIIKTNEMAPEMIEERLTSSSSTSVRIYFRKHDMEILISSADAQCQYLPMRCFLKNKMLAASRKGQKPG